MPRSACSSPSWTDFRRCGGGDMFGKRHALRKPSGGGELALAVDAALDIVAKLSRPAMSGAPVAALDAARSPALVIRSRRSEGYYDIKSSIFNALIDTIDLTQLGQLDNESARDEIRD